MESVEIPRPDVGKVPFMTIPEATDDDAFEAAILKWVLDDLGAGRLLPVDVYRSRYPSHGTLVDRIYREACGDAEPATTGEPPAEELSKRTSVGPYRLVRLLGVGGQGEVYLAIDERLDRKVAVKVLRGLGAASQWIVERFRREAELAARLDHRGICAIFDTGFHQGAPYIVMRYVEGQTLARHIANRQGDSNWYVDDDARLDHPTRDEASRSSLPSAPGLRTTHAPTRGEFESMVLLLEKTARAVQVAHESGVIHCDLKPGNIMVDQSGEPIILDFGLARLWDRDDRTLVTSSLMGTPAYMAPEQLATPMARPDPLTDVWSLGCCLYEALTGRRPFEAPTREGLVQAILRNEPKEPWRFGIRMGRDLGVVVATSLSKERNRRYQSAVAFADELRRVLEGLPIEARPLGPVMRLQRWARRHPSRAAWLCLVLLGVGVLSFVLARWPSWRQDLELARGRREADARETALAEAHLILVTKGAKGHHVELQRSVDDAPDWIEARVALVLFEMTHGTQARAEELLDKAPSNLARHPALIHLRHQITRLRGGSEELPPPDPASPASLFVAAFLEDQRAVFGDVAAARRALALMQQCVAVTPRPRLLYHMEWLRAACLSGDHPSCRAAAAALEALWPTSPQALQSIAFGLYEADPPRAVLAAKEVTRRVPNESKPWVLLAQAELQARDPAAEGHARRATELGPEDPDTWFTWGLTLQAQGDSQRAEEAYRRALARDETSLRSRYNLAVLLWDRSAITEAQEELEMVLKTSPRFALGWQLLANCKTTLGDHDQGEVLARKAVSLDPKWSQAYNTLGTILERKGQLGEAKEAYEQALRLDPSYVRGLSNLAGILMQQGDLKGAQVRLQTAQDLSRRDPSTWTESSARRLTRCNDLLSLEPKLELATSTATLPDSVELRQQLADLAESTHRFTLAAWIWEDLLRTEPNTGGLRVRAAIAAARASDRTLVADRTPAELTTWRTKALTWLEAELEELLRHTDAGRTREARTRRHLEGLRQEPGLAPLRDPTKLAALPTDTAAPWTAFWRRVDEVLQSL